MQIIFAPPPELQVENIEPFPQAPTTSTGQSTGPKRKKLRLPSRVGTTPSKAGLFLKEQQKTNKILEVLLFTYSIQSWPLSYTINNLNQVAKGSSHSRLKFVNYNAK